MVLSIYYQDIVSGTFRSLRQRPPWLQRQVACFTHPTAGPLPMTGQFGL